MKSRCHTLHLFPVRRSLICASILLICLTVVTGCSQGKNLLPITGTIHVDGKPAEGAFVLLHPVDQKGAMPASGVADEEGAFSLVTAQATGVEVGKYKVTVTWPDESKRVALAPGGMGTPDDPPDLLKGRYASLKTTTLETVVESDTKELEPIELEMPK